jgi:archaellum component FlaF (FlaF/FlaG flagellin family)
MPRDGSGVYSLPAGTTASPNTTIESAKYNAFGADLVVDANAARPITAGGTAGATAVEGVDNLSTKGSNIASAATTDIGAATGRFVHITGTTTITALGTKTAGVEREVIFDGALILTHNATSLILPGAANITTAAGDAATFVSEGAGNWRCINYQRGATGPIQAWELIETKTASSSASLNWTGLSAYRALRLTGTVRPSTDAVSAFARVSTNNGSSYDSTSAYNYQIGRIGGATSVPIGGTTTGALIGGTTSLGSSANEYTSFEIIFEQFNKATYMMFHGTAVATSDVGTLVAAVIGGSWGSATARDAIQVIMGSGNIADGYVTLEGMRG